MALADINDLNFLMDALRPYSDDLELVDGRKPFLIRMNGVLYTIFTGLVHDSGNQRDDPTEARIQLSARHRDIQNERAEDARPRFVGFFAKSFNPHPDNIAEYDGAVFSAWLPEYALNKKEKDTGSLYTDFRHEEAALEDGGAVDRLNANTLGFEGQRLGWISTVSLRSEFLGFYLENAEALHRATDNGQLCSAVSAVEAWVATPDQSADQETEVDLGTERTKVTVTRTEYRRDPNFRNQVLNAYAHKCAVCGQQLGLVEAAHIVPHNDAESRNHVSNGVALCASHHRMYDARLLLLGRNGTLHVNENRVEHLENINQTAGLDAIRILAAEGYCLPDDPKHHPNPDYLELGLKIRLGDGG